MTSQGQRFRRRALRRGYKVDEVDAFLDRVEATLHGAPVETPVGAQEVHDVVFRVRFGGYDEWQVDLHLDRVERQLAEVEERGAGFGRGADPRGPDPRGPDQRGVDPRGVDPRMAPPMREDRMPPMDRMGPPMGAPAGPPPMREDRMPPMPARPVSPMAPPPGPPVPMAPPMPPSMSPRRPGVDRYDEPTFAGFEPARHGRDMTAEIRMTDQGYPPPGPAAPPPGVIPGDAQRIDQMRRTFQARRFGSGYDPAQVDRLFDAIMSTMAGRSGMAISEAELDPSQFSLVPGGYFEADVDNALREVREIVRRR